MSGGSSHLPMFSTVFFSRQDAAVTLRMTMFSARNFALHIDNLELRV